MNIINVMVWMCMAINPYKGEKIILKETFSYPDGLLPPSWWSEGCQAGISKGHLYVNADTESFRAATIWLDVPLAGDLQIEFDVKIVSSSDVKNNINCFFLYSHPNGNHLRSSSQERTEAEYTSYHVLKGYIFTSVVSDEQARFRLRDNPGFNLIAENFTGEIKIGEKYHFKIVKIADRFQYWKDSVKILDAVDDKFNPLIKEGLFGFRTWHTALWWDNLVIKQLN